MRTKDKINKLFENLGVWIEFPKYQAERRLDVFFGLYLEDILKECRPCEFTKEDRLVLIPEFPLQKNDINNECTNIDYMVFNVSKQCMHAIELKTDNHSVDDEQIAYYHKFEKIDVERLFDFIIKTKRTGRSGKKYKTLAEYIKGQGLTNCNSKGNVIYLLPSEVQKINDEGFDSVTFAEIADKMKKHTAEDELLSAFLDFIKNINEHQNS